MWTKYNRILCTEIYFFSNANSNIVFNYLYVSRSSGNSEFILNTITGDVGKWIFNSNLWVSKVLRSVRWHVTCFMLIECGFFIQNGFLSLSDMYWRSLPISQLYTKLWYWKWSYDRIWNITIIVFKTKKLVLCSVTTRFGTAYSSRPIILW